MRRKAFLIVAAALVLATMAPVAGAGTNARRPAIEAGANNVVTLQRTDTGWEGTWYWYVGSTYNATNLTGVTALGLLEAYRDVKDPAYLDAAIDAAGFIMAHLGAGATDPYHERTTAPDVVFLHRLSQVTGDASYADRAELEWSNLTSFWPAAGDLDALFRTINRRSAWDIAFFLEAAYLSGDSDWANDAAAILADTTDTFYYGTDTWWYALNVAASIRALVGCGYAGQYNGQVVELLGQLIALADDDNGVGGYVQDTAYAVLAFSTVGGAGRQYANDLGRWLANHQQPTGGWIEAGDEYPEVDGEAVRALASTIGTNVTLDGFQPGTGMNSSWRRAVTGQSAIPYSGD